MGHCVNSTLQYLYYLIQNKAILMFSCITKDATRCSLAYSRKKIQPIKFGAASNRKVSSFFSTTHACSEQVFGNAAASRQEKSA